MTSHSCIHTGAIPGSNYPPRCLWPHDHTLPPSSSWFQVFSSPWWRFAPSGDFDQDDHKPMEARSWLQFWCSLFASSHHFGEIVDHQNKRDTSAWHCRQFFGHTAGGRWPPSRTLFSVDSPASRDPPRIVFARLNRTPSARSGPSSVGVAQVPSWTDREVAAIEA